MIEQARDEAIGIEEASKRLSLSSKLWSKQTISTLGNISCLEKIAILEGGEEEKGLGGGGSFVTGT